MQKKSLTDLKEIGNYMGTWKRSFSFRLIDRSVHLQLSYNTSENKWKEENHCTDLFKVYKASSSIPSLKEMKYMFHALLEISHLPNDEYHLKRGMKSYKDERKTWNRIASIYSRPSNEQFHWKDEPAWDVHWIDIV